MRDAGAWKFICGMAFIYAVLCLFTGCCAEPASVPPEVTARLNRLESKVELIEGDLQGDDDRLDRLEGKPERQFGWSGPYTCEVE